MSRCASRTAGLVAAAVRVGQVRRVFGGGTRLPGGTWQTVAPRRSRAALHRVGGGVTPNTDWHFVEDGEPATQRLHPRMTTTSNDSAIAAAVAGFGIARLLSYQVASHLRAGTLQIMLEEFEQPPWPIHVVHREGRRATQKVRGFIDLAVTMLRADPSLN